MSLRPIPGQPGLFREFGAVDAGLASRIQQVHSDYVTLKGGTQELLRHFPAPLQPNGFVQLVTRIVEIPRSSQTFVRLSAAQLAELLKAALSSAGRNIGMAAAMAGAPDAIARSNRAKIVKLVDTANNVIRVAQQIVNGIQAVASTTERAQRATGLGITGVEIAALVAGAVVAIIGIGLLYTLIAYIAAAIDAYAAAERQCELDSAAGRPCTGTQYQQYREAALEDARRFGLVPNIGDAADRAARSVGDAIFWGSMLTVGGLLAYGAWVSAPAAREARAALHEEVASRRVTRRFKRAGYR